MKGELQVKVLTEQTHEGAGEVMVMNGRGSTAPEVQIDETVIPPPERQRKITELERFVILLDALFDPGRELQCFIEFESIIESRLSKKVSRQKMEVFASMKTEVFIAFSDEIL